MRIIRISNDIGHISPEEASVGNKLEIEKRYRSGEPIDHLSKSFNMSIWNMHDYLVTIMGNEEYNLVGNRREMDLNSLSPKDRMDFINSFASNS